MSGTQSAILRDMGFVRMTLATLFSLACMHCGSNHQSSPTAPSSDYTPLITGASYNCESSGESAYMTYGQATFFAISRSIFVNLATNNTFSIPTDEGNFAAFLVYFFGGPMQILYTNGVEYDLTESLPQTFQLTDYQYEYLVSGIIVPALLSNGVSHSDVESCFVPPLLKNYLGTAS